MATTDKKSILQVCKVVNYQGSKLVTIFPTVYIISYNYEIPKYFQKIAFLKH